MRLPAPVAGPTDDVLPEGTLLRLDAAVRVGEGGRVLVGGDPPRLATLSPAARRVLGGTRTVRVVDEVSAALARRLADGGLAHVEDGPVRATPADVTVVVPVRDRPFTLARLLRALPDDLAVVVVDDGSADAAGTAGVARRHGARLVRHPTARGPAAARNAGLRLVDTALVAFVDSDVVPQRDWLHPLLGQTVDPSMGAVAPRVLGLGPPADGGWVARYERLHSSLDLGSRPARVVPRGRVSYVPSACLLARVNALGTGFDEQLDVAEDVDLVWRLHAAGWRVRYCPAATVRHEHRVSLRGWLGRKAFYGTGAAALAVRHGRAVAPVAMPLWAAATCAAALAQRRAWLPVVAVAPVLAVARLRARLDGLAHPGRTAARLVASGLGSAARQCASALTRHWWPLTAIGALGSRRVRRAALVAALLGGLDDWRRARSTLDPVVFVAARRLDDLAYGAGVWWGAWDAGDARALLPDLTGRPPAGPPHTAPGPRA